MLHGGILGATTYKHGQPKVLPIFSAFSSEMVVVFVSVCLLLMLGSQRPPSPVLAKHQAVAVAGWLVGKRTRSWISWYFMLAACGTQEGTDHVLITLTL